MRPDNTSAKNRLDKNIQPQSRPALWFWIVICIGLAIRVYLALFTEGTYDVGIWQKHADGVRQFGLIRYYHTNEEMNHPPFIGVVASQLSHLSQLTDVPFKVLWRMPFIIVDIGIVILLLQLLRGNRYRFIIAAAYWLNPLSIIFSGYHGNTDLSVAFFLLFCIYLLSEQKIIWAAIMLGVSMWIKLPGILAIPALVFFIPNWRKRFIFLFVTGLAGISTYIPALLIDPIIVYKNVFGYSGIVIITEANIRTWGIRIFLVHFKSLPVFLQKVMVSPITFYLQYEKWCCIVLILLLCWLRRSKRTIRELAITITGVYAIIYGFSNFWSFQYFAWSVPFWFLAPVGFMVPAVILAGGYIYSLYWHVCGNPWLLGQWDFVGHPYWPKYVVLFRNGALLFFLFSACIFLVSGIYAEVTRLRRWRRNLNSVLKKGIDKKP